MEMKTYLNQQLEGNLINKTYHRTVFCWKLIWTMKKASHPDLIFDIFHLILSGGSDPDH